MAVVTDYLAHKILNHVLRNTAYPSPTTVYVSLYTTSPTDTTAGVEVSGGSYAREAVTFSAPVAGGNTNDVDVNFGTATADWGTIVAVGICDALSGGNLLFYSALSTPKTVYNGDPVLVPIGAITVYFP
jgi:hypothetical protein